MKRFYDYQTFSCRIWGRTGGGDCGWQEVLIGGCQNQSFLLSDEIHDGLNLLLAGARVERNPLRLRHLPQIRHEKSLVLPIFSYRIWGRTGRSVTLSKEELVALKELLNKIEL